MQALANSETNTLDDNEVAITEKTLRVKSKKDYDGDGEIESPRDEYMGSKDKAIKKATKKPALEDDEIKDERMFGESLKLLKMFAGI